MNTCTATAGADYLVNGLVKYGGEGRLTMMVMLYNWIWKKEYAPRRWREGVEVRFLKKGDKAGPGNCRGMTLLPGKHLRQISVQYLMQ